MKSKEKITFVQFSDKLTSSNLMGDYYRKAYEKMDGYYYPEHFMEIPLWIVAIDGMLSKEKYESSLYVADNLENALKALTNTNPDEILLMSVMEANAQYGSRHWFKKPKNR